MNSTPADSSLARTQAADSGDDRRGDYCSPDSKATIPFSLAPTRPANFAQVQPSRRRAVLTCSGVIVISRPFAQPDARAVAVRADAELDALIP
jgi:hypothetical protein